MRVHCCALAMFVSLLSTATAEAQTPMTCDALMKFGIHDEFGYTSDKTHFSLVKKWLVDNKFQSYEHAKSEANKLGIGSDIFSVDFNGVTAEKDWAKWSSHLESSSFELLDNRALFVSKARVVSKSLMDVINTCLEKAGPGLYSWIDTTADKKLVNLNVQYKSVGAESARVEASLATNPPEVLKHCANTGALAKGKTLKGVKKTVQCNIEGFQTVGFVVNTDQGDASPLLEIGDQTPKKPPVASLTATPQNVIQGEASTLSWDTQNTVAVKITPGDLAGAQGTKSVTPDASTTYTLIAHGEDGGFVTASATVSVKAAAAKIAKFEASPNQIYLGQSATLSWDTQHASVIQLDQGIGVLATAERSRSVSPTTSTTYTLTAMSPANVDAKNVTITVNPKARLFENHNYDGRAVDIQAGGPVALSVPEGFGGSSVRVFTGEFVTFYRIMGVGFCVLTIKGPRDVNLHDINWADKPLIAVAVTADKPALKCQTTLQ